MTHALEELKKTWRNGFTETWHHRSVPLEYYDTPVFIVYSGDTLHQNTIDDSNVVTIYEELAGNFPGEVHLNPRTYTEEIYVRVEDLESNVALAEQVLAIQKFLDEYAIYDESHYSDLETDRIVEYVEDVLIWDIATNLGMISPAKVRRWVRANDWVLWEHFDGSVDDAPFNTEALTELVRDDLAS